MRITEIAFTAYPVTDLKRARAFYEGVLGLTQSHIFGSEETAWIEYDVGACTFAISNGRPAWKPSTDGGTIGLEVDDFDATITHLQASGVEFKTKPFETPVCHMVVIQDPDGNPLTIHKRKAGRE